MLEGHDEEEEEEAETRGDAIPLEGFQLGGATAGEEHIAKLSRARFQGTLRLLFTPEGPSNQPILKPIRLGRRPSQSSQEFSPLLPPNPQKKRKGSRIVIGPVPQMHLLLDKS
jgi:hypothetical protein